MRSAERGQEIVERRFVGQVDNCEAQAPLVMVGVEEIVITHAGVKQVARFDARRIVIHIECRACDIDQLCARLRGIRAADGPCTHRKSLSHGSRVCDSTGIHAEKPDSSLLRDRKSTRLNSSHVEISYAVFCLKKKKKKNNTRTTESE